MMADLIHNHALIGTERNEIHLLLGKPLDSAINYVAEGGLESYEAPAKSFSTCGYLEPGNLLDLQYVDSKVARLRLRELDWDKSPAQTFASHWIEKNYKW
jgi:hypothetical protein